MADARHHTYPPVAPVVDPPIPGNPIVAPVNANVAVGVNQAVFKMDDAKVGSFIPNADGKIPIEFIGVAMSSYTPREPHLQPPRIRARAKRHKQTDIWECLANDPATISVTVAGSATLSLGYHGSFMDALENESLPVPGEWVAFDFSSTGVAMVTRGGAADRLEARTHAPMVRKYDPGDRKQVPFGICLSYAATPRSEVTVLLRKDVFANDREINGETRRGQASVTGMPVTGAAVASEPNPFLHLFVDTPTDGMEQGLVVTSGHDLTPLEAHARLLLVHAAFASAYDTVMPWAAQNMLVPNKSGKAFEEWSSAEYTSMLGHGYEYVLSFDAGGTAGLLTLRGTATNVKGSDPVDTVDLVKRIKSRNASASVVQAIATEGIIPRDVSYWVDFMYRKHAAAPHEGWGILAVWADDSTTLPSEASCKDQQRIDGDYRRHSACTVEIARDDATGITVKCTVTGSPDKDNVCIGIYANSDGSDVTCAALEALPGFSGRYKIDDFTSILDLERTLCVEEQLTFKIVPMDD
jgi:hypothetical protein